MAPRSMRSKAVPDTESSAINPTLEATEVNPPHCFLLPKNTSRNSRFVSLRNPATQSLERYIYCSSTGLYELRNVPAASNGLQRSILLAGRQPSNLRSRAEAYILRDAHILVATKFDPVFLLSPLFDLSGGKPTKIMARTEEDHWSTLGETSPHMAALLQRPDFCALLQARLSAVCDVVGVMGEEAYRPNLAKFAAELRRKAECMVKTSVWPASLEEEYTRKPLEPPSMPVRQKLVRQGDMNFDENHRADTAETSPDGKTSEQKQEDEDEMIAVSEPVKMLARLKTALNLILHSYVTKHLHGPIWNAMAAHDFGPLETQLSAIAKLRTEAQALRSLSDNISRKRAAADDDEAAEIRAEKKRKKEEEDLRKKNESRAAKQLKKVDTSVLLSSIHPDLSCLDEPFLLLQKLMLLHSAFLEVHEEEQEQKAGQAQCKQEVEWCAVVVRRTCIDNGAAHEWADEAARFADDGEEREEKKLMAPRSHLAYKYLAINIPLADKQAIHSLIYPNLPCFVEAELLGPDSDHAPAIE
ncbi:hypothetical protein FH972_022259 [Carpinus fangiana]|uniref:Ribonuclease H2 subunit B n=1 Tax=Carpinus fangiana TaxID=176857 RepID=A0A5N6KRQ7_9ROSI|nr:hypothetical protein FH972_022259 [Carpinus fangiana]